MHKQSCNNPFHKIYTGKAVRCMVLVTYTLFLSLYHEYRMNCFVLFKPWSYIVTGAENNAKINAHWLVDNVQLVRSRRKCSELFF